MPITTLHAFADTLVAMRPTLADFHTHSTCSDGALTPTRLVRAAEQQGVSALAVTDHDTLAAWPELCALTDSDLTLIPGIELSARWGNANIHIVGLNVDPQALLLQQGIEAQKRARDERAQRIARRLARRRIPDPLEGAMRFANGATLGRPHFAAHLVECGAVPDRQTAFKKYLGRGRPGDVRTDWPQLDTIVSWIHSAGGVAVLAHPAKYRLTRSKLAELVRAFCAAGGDALEVISGAQTPDRTRALTQLCEGANLLASAGSDFHAPDQPWARLGHKLTLPRQLTPVWSAWDH